MEAITNRTVAQEQELKDKKKELTELEKQQGQNSKPTNRKPWIIGGSIVGGVLVIGLIVYLWTKNRQEEKKTQNIYITYRLVKLDCCNLT